MPVNEHVLTVVRGWIEKAESAVPEPFMHNDDWMSKYSRVLIKAELQRGPEFLRLASAHLALYPKAYKEKYPLDAMLPALLR